jgi:hypothetical protein
MLKTRNIIDKKSIFTTKIFDFSFKNVTFIYRYFKITFMKIGSREDWYKLAPKDL